MAESILDQIKKIEATIQKFEKLIKDMESDGVTPDEEKRIAQTRGEIAKLQTELAARKKEFEANRDKWKSKAGQLKTAQEQVKTITDWGAIDIKSVASDLVDAEKLAKQENYRDANTLLDDVTAGLAKPWAEYEKQFKAKGEYDSDIQDVENRLNEAKNNKFQTDSVKKGTATLDANLPQIKKYADAKDYVSAVKELKPAHGELDLIEKEITKANDEDAAARKELEPVKTKAGELSKIEFEELKQRIATAQGQVTQIETAIDAFDFNNARAEIGTLSGEIDAIKAEAEKLEAKKKAEEEKKKKEKEAWEKAAPRFEALKTKVGELETWDMPEAKTLRQEITDIDGYVGTEDYVGALDKLGLAEHDLAKPYAEYQKQKEAKATYDGERPGIDTRAQTARQSEYVKDPELGKMIGDLDTDLTFMDDKAKSKDFVQANTKLAGCGTKLDKIERKIRDLEAEAKYGGGDEAKKQLYLQEQPLAKERVDKVEKADILTKQTDAQFKKIAEELGNAEKDFNAQKYGQALDTVRTVIDEMPFVEEEVRSQTEAKKLYEEALKATQASVAEFDKSLHKKVREDGAALGKGLTKGENAAKDHDYKTALAEAETWVTEVQRITDEETQITKDHADADAALIEIQGRLEKAIATEVEGVKAQAKDLQKQKDEVDKVYKDEDFKAALGLIGKLKENLEAFEKEENKQKQKELYESFAEAMRIDARLKEAWDLQYPESGDQVTKADGLDKERKALAGKDEYEEARKKCSDEATALDEFDTRKGEIEAAKAQYDANFSTLKSQADEALAPMDPTSGELVDAQNKLKEKMAAIEKAAAAKQFIEANKQLEEAKAQVDAVMKIREELTPVDEAKTVEYINGVVSTAATAFGAGAANAVTNFRIDVMERVNEERGPQTFAKWSGFALDVTAAIAGACPGAGPIVAGIAGGVKTVIAIVADRHDAAEDDEDKRVGNELMNQLSKQAGEVEGAFNRNYGGTMKAQNKAAFDSVGKCLTKKDDPGARSALKAAGVPVNVGVMDTSAQFLGQLRSKMAATRG